MMLYVVSCLWQIEGWKYKYAMQQIPQTPEGFEAKQNELADFFAAVEVCDETEG